MSLCLTNVEGEHENNSFYTKSELYIWLDHSDKTLRAKRSLNRLKLKKLNKFKKHIQPFFYWVKDQYSRLYIPTLGPMLIVKHLPKKDYGAFAFAVHLLELLSCPSSLFSQSPTPPPLTPLPPALCPPDPKTTQYIRRGYACGVPN